MPGSDTLTFPQTKEEPADIHISEKFRGSVSELPLVFIRIIQYNKIQFFCIQKHMNVSDKEPAKSQRRKVP